MDKGYELYNAVKKAEKVEKIREMIRNGADVNYVFLPEEYGLSPLHMAAYFAKNDIIELLLVNGANVNCYSLEGKTPLDFAIKRHNREKTISLLLNYGATNGTAPMPDFATVGDVFLTTEDKYLLVLENGKIQEFDKMSLYNLMEKRRSFSALGEEIAICFDDINKNNTSIYYAFSLPKRKVISEEKEIPEYIDTRKHPEFKLALVTDEIAVYVNSGDDVLTMDLVSKTIMDEVAGVKKYHETMEKIINEGKEYEYGEKLVSYCRRNHAFERKQPNSEELGETLPAGQLKHRRHGRWDVILAVKKHRHISVFFYDQNKYIDKMEIKWYTYIR